jgi:hypothetical protein
MYKTMVSYHTNTWGCGIAKFNSLLADQMGLGVKSISDWIGSPEPNALLSISINEFNDEDKILLSNTLIQNPDLKFGLVLHSFSQTNLEYFLCEAATRIYGLNSEIADVLVGEGFEITQLFTPSLLDQDNFIDTSNTFHLFTFGMAHKMELKLVGELINKLRQLGKEPLISLSTALHVNEQPLDSLQDSIKLLSKTAAVPVNFLGFLSDSALRYEMERAHGFFRFFENGVRANSTSVMASMSAGVATFTNLDEFSPKWLIHGENVIDVNSWNALEEDLNLEVIGKMGKRNYADNISWNKLSQFLKL